MEVELYEEDYKLILEALSNYKYIINKFSFLHRFDSEKVFQSNYDIDFLYQILETIYIKNFIRNKTNYKLEE